MNGDFKHNLVSIIVPSFNNACHIVETLVSVINQTYTYWECIIVDDGSTDVTIQLVDEYCKQDARFKFYRRPPNKLKGANACRNIGFEHSKGTFIMFLDADDILSVNCLQNRVNEFSKNSTLDFVIANTSFYSDGVFLNVPICKYPLNYTAGMYLNLFLSYKLPWTIMSVLWKRAAISTVSFDETLSRFQDVDFHIQILLHDKLQCIRLNEVDTFYRSNTGSKESYEYYEKVVKASKLFFKKYLSGQYLDSDQKKKFRRFIILFLIKHIYPFQRKLSGEVNEIDAIIKLSKVFSLKELVLLKIYKFVIKYDLHTQTGLGMHKFTKALKKGLRYDR